MEKIDYKKKLKHLYKPSAKKVELINGPSMNFLINERKNIEIDNGEIHLENHWWVWEWFMDL